VIKRAIDIVGSIIGIILLLPIFVVTILILYLSHGSPIFFRQTRIGFACKKFEIIKFRTMTNKLDSSGYLLSDINRLHSFGEFLRKTSIDELPELWNVIKGDMSLVGPRPLLVEYLDYYTEDELTRHNVRPGITGLAQISGRNYLGWDEQLKIDIKYVKEKNLFLDILILLKTIKKVILREDIIVIPEEKRRSLKEERSNQKI
jgi:sugar transferase EpsL